MKWRSRGNWDKLSTLLFIIKMEKTALYQAIRKTSAKDSDEISIPSAAKRLT